MKIKYVYVNTNDSSKLVVIQDGKTCHYRRYKDGFIQSEYRRKRLIVPKGFDLIAKIHL